MKILKHPTSIVLMLFFLRQIKYECRAPTFPQTIYVDEVADRENIIYINKVFSTLAAQLIGCHQMLCCIKV